MSQRSHSNYPPRRRPKRKSRLAPLLALVAFLVVLGGGALGVAVWWPSAAFGADPQALTAIKLAPDGEKVTAVTVRDASGHRIPARNRGGRIFPSGKLASGEALEIDATVTRAGWIGWLVGHSTHIHETVTTPKAEVSATLLHLHENDPVLVTFDHPASVVVLRLPGFPVDHLSFQHPRRRVDTGLRASGKSRFGVATVAVAARPWERLSPAVRVSWFPEGLHLQAVVKPTPGTTIDPGTKITLTFSVPVKALFGVTRPKLEPATPGTWMQTAPNALTFRPSEGFGLGTHVSISLPSPTDVLAAGQTQTFTTLTWSIPGGSFTRLQQVLAGLGYLPLEWHPAGAAVPATRLAQTMAAIDPPAGTYTWRYPDTPSELRSLWRPDAWTRMTQGAVMAFEHDQGLTVDGIAGPVVWRSLIAAAIKGAAAPRSYSYVFVHRNVPQNLTLWNNGQTIMNVKINTGVPAAPTPYGTHAVFEHIPIGTMRGENPDGSHYVDPGIRWISYFYGGEAIHGFNRATYGFPQSVGCVEAPIATAAKIWPYTPIGTLVSIVP